MTDPTPHGEEAPWGVERRHRRGWYIVRHHPAPGVEWEAIGPMLTKGAAHRAARRHSPPVGRGTE